MFGYYRIALCVPAVKVADPAANAEAILRLARRAAENRAALALFPELAVTGASCGDLFRQDALLDASDAALRRIAAETEDSSLIVVVGAPLRCRGRIYDAVLVMQHGRLLGAVPAASPRGGLLGSGRAFADGAGMRGATVDLPFCAGIPFGRDLLFEAPGTPFGFAPVPGDDRLAAADPAAARAASAGVPLLLLASAAAETAGAAAKRRRRIRVIGESLRAAVALVSAGSSESTTDAVGCGAAFAVQEGDPVAEGAALPRQDSVTFADLDLGRIAGARRNDPGSPAAPGPDAELRRIAVAAPAEEPGVPARVEPHPFLPSDEAERREFCREILSLQCAALARRIEHVGARRLVLGISGGLDSTLALLAGVSTLKLLGRPASDLITVTMPGFGTSGRTHRNAVGLCRALGCDLREIPIRDACLEHFRSIGHDPERRDVVYENAQARERTQILLDLANQEGGLVLGTGDLSEIAMGWCTYNGDHISMYGMNGTVPKSSIRFVIDAWCADAPEAVKEILEDIVETPVSPELLPAEGDGAIAQKTEEIIGPYELHDFFLYHLVTGNASPEKILGLAGIAFAGVYPPEAQKKYLELFLRRFFAQQFKRSCMPDGAGAGTVSLSPRGGWEMPSDASGAAWLSSLRSNAENAGKECRK